MCRVRGIEEESPGIQWKSQLCNLNILTVGFASLPSVFPRWNSLRSVYHTLSRWRALGRTLMGADLCLLRVPSAAQRARHGSWGHGRSALPMSHRKGSTSSSFCTFLSLLDRTAAFLRKSSGGIFWRNSCTLIHPLETPALSKQFPFQERANFKASSGLKTKTLPPQNSEEKHVSSYPL